MAEPSMEVAAVDNSNSLIQTPADADNPSEAAVPQPPNHEGMEPKNVINADEVRSIMEVIATTGKFWDTRYSVEDVDFVNSALAVLQMQVAGYKCRYEGNVLMCNGLTGVLFALPDSYVDVENKDYGEFYAWSDMCVYLCLQKMHARHDWDMLKSMLSFRLKQVWEVLAEYPESYMVSGDDSQHRSLLGETYPELVKRLDEALLSFIEGPPFTLQRLCEILLDPKSTYRSLTKLALALEKNLLVTSTLTMSTDPYPTISVRKVEEPDKLSEKPQEPSDVVPNGIESTVDDGDEEMVEAEAEEDAMNTDTEMREEKVTETSEVNSETSLVSDPLQDENPVTSE